MRRFASRQRVAERNQIDRRLPGRGWLARARAVLNGQLGGGDGDDVAAFEMPASTGCDGFAVDATVSSSAMVFHPERAVGPGCEYDAVVRDADACIPCLESVRLHEIDATGRANRVLPWRRGVAAFIACERDERRRHIRCFVMCGCMSRAIRFQW
ncbi:hypothetical protein BP1026B_II0123 [Burkholderia pseudomallei 1026b]|uniref:Uncharacterized protein n=1 Tax=Burkholderia pseudomallei (strain 1026b) TaxID=884204 RepID=A0A0H3HR84_BURP2|nr:hypothetical protein BP1026B_II0123 [Burkholderia pseudomallei 1026b]EIF63404.1 hypothetical protein BP1026A_1813 [Burkholderia pseudomallei 1026a]